MKNKKFFLIAAFLLGVLVSYSVPIRSSNILAAMGLATNDHPLATATANHLLEGVDGFYPVQSGQMLTYEVTDGTGIYVIGDRVRIRFSGVNNSLDQSGQIVEPSNYVSDMLYGYIDSYDPVTKVWTLSTTELAFASYNSTVAFTECLSGAPDLYGEYNSLIIGAFPFAAALGMPMSPVPRNFTCTNHTIVNTTYAAWYTDDFFYNTPNGTVEGVWTAGIYGPTHPSGFKIEWTIDHKGICTKQRVYTDGPHYWLLGYELTLLEDKTIDLLPLLFLLFAQPSTDLLIPILIGVGAAIGIITLLAALENKGYLAHRITKTTPY